MIIHNNCGLCRIDIENLSVTDGDQTIIDNVNISLACGELTALIGRNGAGKTTLIKAILGERKHTGSISYFDCNEKSFSKAKIGYVPQQLVFDKSAPVSVLDFAAASLGIKKPVWLGHSAEVKRRIQAMLETMECAHIAQKRLGDLSGGEMQRLLLALAINANPDMLILDEPVSGIDVAGVDIFYKTVAELRDKRHMPILLVSHDLELIKKYADEVILLDKTVVAKGSADEVLKKATFNKNIL